MNAKGFVDFEYNQNHDGDVEIISIGVVVLDDKLKEIGQFYRLIKPSLCTVLNSYVSKITGIRQQDLNGADSFFKVSNDFSEFIKMFNITSFFCWGKYDNKALTSSSRINNCNIMKNLIGTIINVQSMISSSIRYEGRVINKNISLDTVRKFYGIAENTRHNSLNDAIILSKIYSAYIENGIYNYPNGFSNGQEASTADIIAKELFLKSVANEQWLDNHDRCLSLVEFIDGETSINSSLSRSIFDIAKRCFYKNEDFVSKDFDIFSISYDDLEKYSISIYINTKEDNVLLSIHRNEKLLSILVNTTSKNKTILRKLLKRMK